MLAQEVGELAACFWTLEVYVGNVCNVSGSKSSAMTYQGYRVEVGSYTVLWRL